MESKRFAGVMVWCLVLLLVVSQEVQADSNVKVPGNYFCEHGLESCVTKVCRHDREGQNALECESICLLICAIAEGIKQEEYAKSLSKAHVKSSHKAHAKSSHKAHVKSSRKVKN